MHHTEAGGRFIFHHKVSIGDSIDAVPAELAEAQLAGDEVPIDIIGDTSDRSAAQGHNIGALQAIVKAAGIPLEHLEIG